MAENSRESLLSNYKELQKGLLETLAMQNEGDDEVEALIHEFEEQLQLLAAVLNADETIEVTPNLLKVQLPNNLNNGNPVILFPPPGTLQDALSVMKPAGDAIRNENHALTSSPMLPLQNAPYEVLYDESTWYPCVITEVLPPATPIDRIQYRAWILGYNIEEVVLSESLRVWSAAEVGAQLRSGLLCHAIRPTTGLYEPATVVRLTLESTAIVSFAQRDPVRQTMESGAAEKCDPVTENKEMKDHDLVEVEVPLSHVHVGRFFQVLRKRPKLTEQERAAQRAENARKKRDRIALDKQMRADRIAQDANDWKALLGDIMGTAGPKKKPRL